MDRLRDLVLATHGVSHAFGEVQALRAVDLDVHAGEVVGLLGPNGAGKTTLVRIVATLLEPDAGSVTVCGADVRRDAARVRSHLGLAGQNASVDELLTGRENLQLIGRLYGIAARDCATRSSELLAAVGLVDAADRRVGTYSGGMRRRLDLAATLVGEPSLLLLDEPTTGLDPRSRLDMWDLVDAIADRGAAVLVTSQNLEEVERLADRVVVLDGGAVIADDHPQALRRHIGGQVLDVRVDDGLADVARALDTAGLAALTDPTRGRVTAPTTGALPVALDAGHRLVEAHVEPTEFSLRMPSLEEAFLALTGGGTAVDAAAAAASAGGSASAAGVRADGAVDAAVDAAGAAAASADGGDNPGAVGSAGLPTRSRPAVTRSALRDIAVMTGRNWKRLVRTPQSVFFAAVQPVLFVLGLAAVFGDLVENVVGSDYIQFLLPGVLVMQVTLAAGTTGVGLATDLRDGIVDRFRSLPIAPISVLAGRTTTDLVRNALAVAVMVLAGFAIGFRLEGGVAGGLAALAVALLFGYAATWLFAAVGLAVRDPQAASFLGFAPVLLFVYLSSAWVPIDTMDSTVQGFARHQPVNVTIEAVRALANGTPAAAEIAQSLAWSLALFATLATLATRLLRNLDRTRPHRAGRVHIS